MIIDFPCCLRPNSGDWEESIEVTDEECERLKKAFLTGKDFIYCEEVKDIFDRVYEIVVESATDSLLTYNEDIAEEYGNVDNWRADELYQVGIRFPDEFEELLE